MPRRARWQGAPEGPRRRDGRQAPPEPEEQPDSAGPARGDCPGRAVRPGRRAVRPWCAGAPGFGGEGVPDGWGAGTAPVGGCGASCPGAPCWAGAAGASWGKGLWAPGIPEGGVRSTSAGTSAVRGRGASITPCSCLTGAGERSRSDGSCAAASAAAWASLLRASSPAPPCAGRRGAGASSGMSNREIPGAVSWDSTTVWVSPVARCASA